MATASGQEVCQLFQKLEQQRANWSSLWQEVSEVAWPDWSEFTSKKPEGTKRTQRVYDSSATVASERFSAFMMALNTPPTQSWHALRPMDKQLRDDRETMSWLDDLTDLLFEIRAQPESGYYPAIHEVYKSLGVFGTGVLFVDAPQGEILYRAVPLSQVYCQTNDIGVIDTVFRKYALSARAAFQRWGDALPEKIKGELQREPWKMFDFLHVVFPRPEVDSNRADDAGKTFISLDVALDDRVVLREGGYHEQPYMVARYSVNPAEVYGRGPGIWVLPDILTLQEMTKTHLRAGRRAVDPPLLAHDDSIFGSGGKTIDLRANAVNYGAVDPQGRQLVHPFVTGARLDINHEMMERMRQSINDAFLVSLYQVLVERPDMTATEVLMRAQEKGQLTTPAVGRIQSDLLGPQVTREVNLVLRSGRMAPPPVQFAQRRGRYKILYQSEATRLQRSEELQNIQRALQALVPFAATNPSLLDQVFKPFEIAKLAAEVYSLPQRILMSDEERQEVMERQAQAAAEQDAMEHGPSIAAGLSDMATAAKTMGEVRGVQRAA